MTDPSKAMNAKLYEQINSLIGPTDPTQKFVLMMPGMALNPNDYRWNSDDPTAFNQGTGRKPSEVADRESRLAEMMFSTSNVVGGPNGQSVSQEYTSALRKLFPKVDTSIEERRAQAREIIFSDIEGTLEGKPFSGSLIDYYYELRQACIDAHKDFSDQQENEWKKAKERAELAKESGDPGEQTVLPPDSKGRPAPNWDAKPSEIFNRWYQSAAPNFLQRIQLANDIAHANLAPEEYGLLMAVFNTSQGADRLKELIDRVDLVSKASQDGSRTLPVNLSPSNWAEALYPRTNPLDLLKSPEAIENKLKAVEGRERSALRVLNLVKANLPAEDALTTAIKATEDARKERESARAKLMENMSANAVTVVDTYITLSTAGLLSPGEKQAAEPADDTDGNVSVLGTALSKIDFEKIKTGLTGLGKAQSDYMAKARALTARKADQLAIANQRTKQGAVDALKALSDATSEIDSLKQELKLARLAEKSRKIEAEEAKQARDTSDPSADNPGSETGAGAGTGTGASGPQTKQAAVEDGNWMTFVQSVSSEEISQFETEQSSVAESEWEVNGLIGSASGNVSSSSSSFFSNTESESLSVDVGASIMKVNIDRPWMDPGIFKQLGNFWRLSSKRISNGTFKRSEGETRSDETLFPGFPVAFIIAKDVSITLRSSNSSSTSYRQSAERHVDAGGGFLCFSASHSSDSNGSTSETVAQSDGEGLTLRIPNPQIIGWILQATPRDDTEMLPELNKKSNVFSSLTNAILGDRADPN